MIELQKKNYDEQLVEFGVSKKFENLVITNFRFCNLVRIIGHVREIR